jgi:acetylornithine/succinyldiaminopimelate/putrescine aminotransferase/predicted amino acid dehydrogenase/acyl-coenzyme A synthetase/AMP-(fatty) acid ligase
MNTSFKNIIDQNNRKYFDVHLDSGFTENNKYCKNLGSLLFHDLPGRDNRSTVIISHISENLIKISLHDLRNVVGKLFVNFDLIGIRHGDTVFLANLECNSEIYTAILFLALSAYGARVFMPMYLEKDLLEKWHQQANLNYMIIPGEEILKLNHHERQKESIAHLKNLAVKFGIPCLDQYTDLQMDEYLMKLPAKINLAEERLIGRVIEKVKETDVALMITTSGTSGESKVVFYDHQSFLINIKAWEKAGLFDLQKLGGRGFTPLFTHTMGIRTFLNALYLGKAVILINSEWIMEKPESVAYFLMESKPEHITGGPAVFNILLEFSRVFPDLKQDIRENLKTIVSSGTAVNEEVIDKLKEAFNVSVYNAFGTTETQQVLNTLVNRSGHNRDFRSLGGLMPGVSIGLKKITGAPDRYRMYIKSRYGGIRIIEKDQQLDLKDKYIYLGDTVKYINGELFYTGREQPDYFKDEFGVKIPVDKIRKIYNSLYLKVYHIKIFPVRFKPGLAAILFINGSINFNSLKDKKKVISEMHDLIEKINNEQYRTLEPLEFNHWTIKRFSCIQSSDITNRKGIISNFKIERDFGDLVSELTEDNRSRTNIVEVRSIVEKSNTYSMFHNPYIGKLLSCLNLDISFTNGQGDYLSCRVHNQDKKILDLTGGYGTNLLGHHNERLSEIAVQFFKSSEIPLSDQLSLQKYPGQLAEKLNEMIGNYTGKSYFTLFGSAGSEVVEISIHHAYLEWLKRIRKLEIDQIKRFSYAMEPEFNRIWRKNWEEIHSALPVVIANKNAFHGTSSGARSMMGDEERRNKFKGLLKIHSVFIDDADPDFTEKIHEAVSSNKIELQVFTMKGHKIEIIPYEFCTIIGAFVEPVLGEGGIREINQDFPKELSKFDFPLVVDEIQSGLGRTGTFLSSQGFTGNYYLFSKALGGNIAKISAISIEKERYIEEIGKLYLSTFAGGGFAAKIALENLKIIERENIPGRARDIGKQIIRKLIKIKEKYPEVIEGIYGRGLMIGIKFNAGAIEGNLFLRILSRRKVLGYLFSSYLLNRHSLRVFPSLSAPNMLRIEPSICFSGRDLLNLSKGIAKLADLIARDNFYELVRHLMNEDPYIDNKNKFPENGFLHTKLDVPSDSATKIAFIAHFAYPVEEFRMLSKELVKASDTGIRQLFSKFEVIMDLEPFILYAKNLFGGKIHLSTILLPLDSAELEKLHRTDKRDKVIRKIQEGIDMAAAIGAKIISLGGYTSIITQNGKSVLQPKGTRLVTGNTLTAVVGYNNFKRELRKVFSEDSGLRIGVVGANGNIGKILASKFLQDSSLKIKELILMGRNLQKLEEVRTDLMGQDPQACGKVSIYENLKNLNRCDAFIVAINSNDPVIYPAHIKKNGKVLIADLSVPRGVSAEVGQNENVRILPFVSSVKLPEDQDFLATSCSPRGTALCCMAEAILMAMAYITDDLRGDITIEGVNNVHDAAQKAGFIGHTEDVRSYKSRLVHEKSV